MNQWCRSSPRSAVGCALPLLGVGAGGRPDVLFYSGLQLVRQGPLILWRVICLFKVHRFSVNLIQRFLASWHIKLTVTVHKGGHSGFRGVCLKFSSAAGLLLQSIPAHLPGAFPASPASSCLCFGMLSTQSSPASRPDEESCLLVDPRGLTVHGGHAVNAG